MTLDKKAEARYSVKFGRVKKHKPKLCYLCFSQNIKSQASEILYLFCVECDVKFSSIVSLLLHQ